jgi:hypothetical protein
MFTYDILTEMAFKEYEEIFDLLIAEHKEKKDG